MQELLEPVPEEDHLINGRAEVFFHTSMQYDHTIMRWEHDWAGTEPCGSHDVTVPIQIEVMLRTVRVASASMVTLCRVSLLSAPTWTVCSEDCFGQRNFRGA